MNHRIVALAVLGQRRCQLRETLQARQLVEHEPDALLVQALGSLRSRRTSMSIHTLCRGRRACALGLAAT